MAAIVLVKGLFVTRDGHTVLEDVNLELNEGNFLGLIGPNGGGKSTLLKVMLGLIKPDRGDVRIFGLEPAQARKLVGYMPQKTLFDQSFPVTALDVVLMGRYNQAGLFQQIQFRRSQSSFESPGGCGHGEAMQDVKLVLSLGGSSKEYSLLDPWSLTLSCFYWMSLPLELTPPSRLSSTICSAALTGRWA